MNSGIRSGREVKKTKTGYFLWAYSISKIIVNVEQSSFSRVVLNVSRLVGIKEIIGSEVFSKSRCNNTFDDFSNERKIRNRTIVWELVFIEIIIYKQIGYCRSLESSMELTRARDKTDYVSDSGDNNWSTFLKKPGCDRIRIKLLGKLRRIFEISDSVAGLKVELSILSTFFRLIPHSCMKILINTYFVTIH